ncbi:hypothetical protein [Haloarcula sediminis]|uniref:hypothetical protein n=1 Tax=Haloarcula sediminis TaxID=3111777 RepID=UPI002D7660DB|nr:hypothetical protein [Haloarcula sp. CK38]
MSKQQSDDPTEELTAAIEANPEAFATFVRNLDTVNELVEVAELGTAAMDDEMVAELARTGSSLAELADVAADDDARRGIEALLRALGEADANGPVDRYDVWEGLRDGEFLAGVRYALSMVRSLGRAVKDR